MCIWTTSSSLVKRINMQHKIVSYVTTIQVFVSHSSLCRQLISNFPSFAILCHIFYKSDTYMAL